MNLFSWLPKLSRSFFQSFLPEEADAEYRRRAYVGLGFSFIGIIFLAAFGLIALFNRELNVAVADFSAAAVLASALIYARICKNAHLASHIGVYIIGAAFFYLLVIGGQGKTTFLWCYAYPLAACFLLGSRKGILLSSLLLLAASAFFVFGRWFSLQASYSDSFVIRFVSAYVVVSLFSFFVEYFREAAQRVLAEQNRKLQEKMAELAMKEQELERTNQELVREIEHRRSVQKDLALAKEEAVKANRAKSQFLANMSHELRTPLNHIIGFSELLYHERLGKLEDRQKEHLKDVLESSRHLLSLINDLLDLSKIEAGRVELSVSPVDIRALLEHGIAMVSELAQRKRIHLSLECRDLPATVALDERKVKQILFNLLSNAVKFTESGGWVRLKCRAFACNVRGGVRKGDPAAMRVFDHSDGTAARANGENRQCIECSVQDNGIGIRKEDLSRLFERFTQLEPALSRGYQGTGLGLALCRQLVELHGGRIWAESPGPGQGSTFTFIIPVG